MPLERQFRSATARLQPACSVTSFPPGFVGHRLYLQSIILCHAIKTCEGHISWRTIAPFYPAGETPQRNRQHAHSREAHALLRPTSGNPTLSVHLCLLLYISAALPSRSLKVDSRQLHTAPLPLAFVPVRKPGPRCPFAGVATNLVEGTGQKSV